MARPVSRLRTWPSLRDLASLTSPSGPLGAARANFRDARKFSRAARRALRARRRWASIFLFLHFMRGGLTGPEGRSNFLSARVALSVQCAFAWIFILRGVLRR